jgi:hypothetical protein
MDCLNLNSLNISKNHFGDEGLISFIKQMESTATAITLEKLDISSTKLSEKGLIFLLENMNSFPNLKQLKCTDNYIS